MRTGITGICLSAIAIAFLFANTDVAVAQLQPAALTADETTQYAFAEAVRIRNEAKRLQGEAVRLRSERTRLLTEQKRLVDAADKLDARWLESGQPEYAGRDRSQKIMRDDAKRLEVDAGRLESEVSQLENEAGRLQVLARAVDEDVIDRMKRISPEDDVIDRMKKPQSTRTIDDMREVIRQLARTLSVKWNPS